MDIIGLSTRKGIENYEDSKIIFSKVHKYGKLYTDRESVEFDRSSSDHDHEWLNRKLEAIESGKVYTPPEIKNRNPTRKSPASSTVSADLPPEDGKTPKSEEEFLDKQLGKKNHRILKKLSTKISWTDMESYKRNATRLLQASKAGEGSLGPLIKKIGDKYTSLTGNKWQNVEGFFKVNKNNGKNQPEQSGLPVLTKFLSIIVYVYDINASDVEIPTEVKAKNILRKLNSENIHLTQTDWNILSDYWDKENSTRDELTEQRDAARKGNSAVVQNNVEGNYTEAKKGNIPSERAKLLIQEQQREFLRKNAVEPSPII